MSQPFLPTPIAQLRQLAINFTNVTPDAGVAAALATLDGLKNSSNASDFDATADVMKCLGGEIEFHNKPYSVCALNLLNALLAMPMNQTY